MESTGNTGRRVTVRSILKTVSDADVAECVRELIAWQDSDKLCGGALTALAERLVSETGVDEMSSLQHAEAAVLREAAVRFAAVHPSGAPA
jgi:hypothetical protein